MNNVKLLEKVNSKKEDILKTEIGWCEPWIFTFDDTSLSNLKVLSRLKTKSNSFFSLF